MEDIENSIRMLRNSLVYAKMIFMHNDPENKYAEVLEKIVKLEEAFERVKQC